MYRLYNEQIKRLKWVIKNWGLFKNKPDQAVEEYNKKFPEVPVTLRFGLCTNFLDNHNFVNPLSNKLREKMFKAFPKYSGDEAYPLADFECYHSNTNFTQTPERLELAKHCLKYLKNKRKKLEKRSSS